MKTAKKRNPVLGLPEGAWFYEPLPGFPSDPGSQFRFFKEAKNEAEAVREAKAMIRVLGPEVVVERPTIPGEPFRLHHGEAVAPRGLFDMERSWFPHVSNLNPIYKEGNPSRGADSRWVKPKRGGRLWENTGRTNGGWTVILWQDTGRGMARKTLLVSLETFRKNWIAQDEDGNFTEAVHAPDPSPMDNPGYHRRRRPEERKPHYVKPAIWIDYEDEQRGRP